MKNLQIFTCSILVALSFAWAQSEYTVSVYGIEGIGINRDLALSLQEQLESNLTRYNRFRVVSRNDMDKVLAENRIQQSGICLDEECLAKAGSVLGVDEIITGTISRIGHTYNIVLKQISVENGTIRSSVNKQFTGTVDSLLNVASLALFELISPAPEVVRPAPQIFRDTVYSTDTVVVTIESNLENLKESIEGKEVSSVENTASDSNVVADKSFARKIGAGALVVFGSLGLIFIFSSLK